MTDTDPRLYVALGELLCITAEGWGIPRTKKARDAVYNASCDPTPDTAAESWVNTGAAHLRGTMEQWRAKYALSLSDEFEIVRYWRTVPEIEAAQRLNRNVIGGAEMVSSPECLTRSAIAARFAGNIDHAGLPDDAVLMHIDASDWAAVNRPHQDRIASLALSAWFLAGGSSTALILADGDRVLDALNCTTPPK